MKERRETRFRDQALVFLLAPLLILLIPVLVCILIMLPVVRAFIYVAMWTSWSTRGIRLLFVHSDSPVWQDHIRQDILPRLPDKSLVLNWSERKKWRPSLAAMVFHHFGGHRDFNPLAVVIKPFRRAKVFRFHQAFADWKHGKPEALTKMETEFFAALER